MKAKAKIDIENKYKPQLEEFVPMNAQERKEYRTSHPKAEETDLYKKILKTVLFCKAGDEITIIHDNPGAWQVVVVIENKQGERLFTKWDNLEPIKNG